MIVVDTSALVAMAFDEPDRQLYADALELADAAVMSPVNYLETGILLSQRRFAASQGELDLWLKQVGVTIVDNLPLSALSLGAYLKFGKGLHPARLNLGDCFSYALARRLDAPLLFKGDDFAMTDIRSAL